MLNLFLTFIHIRIDPLDLGVFMLFVAFLYLGAAIFILYGINIV
jgi:hypothetical protein